MKKHKRKFFVHDKFEESMGINMELREIYEQINGDYDSVFSRLHNDERIKKYLLKFINNKLDTLIRNALDAGDYETAFREAHNLKGICANLNIDKLGKSASELTEALRGRNPEVDISSLVEAMQADYDMTIRALNVLTEE